MERSDPWELTWEQRRSIIFDALDEARTVLLALGLIQEGDEISNEKLIELMSGMRKVEINRRNAEWWMRKKNIHAALEKEREAREGERIATASVSTGLAMTGKGEGHGRKSL